MKTKTLNGAAYQAPTLHAVEIDAEGVLCASGDTPWYQKGGQGDFTHGVETDDTWA